MSCGCIDRALWLQSRTGIDARVWHGLVRAAVIVAAGAAIAIAFIYGTA